ncbi:MAG: 1-deoxy-D-xylulose-5-phosphate reductoisomerase [Clostridiales Family XIII bacterium]|jgi:1-deoxy-D-xylulose-5-phosphate reductoisomerase|nr:1-deoxy-D-xylulose-5-phosphate reductoisomerase [Clostridiales Family XIII bacterium]
MEAAKKIGIFGATGSIGTQALEIVRGSGGRLTVSCLSCGRNADLMMEQIAEFRPAAAAVFDEAGAERVRTAFPDVTVFAGPTAGAELAREGEYDVMLNALVGAAGLSPTDAAIDRLSGRDGGYIALANKETLACAGRLICEKARGAAVPIVPIDSEHSAIFQCLRAASPAGQAAADNTDEPSPCVDNTDEPSPCVACAAAAPVCMDGVEKLVLTASGGPFRGLRRQELADVTAAAALRHPNWSMGTKVTLDSATLLNKGLEIIEAKWLFGIPPERIEVLVHPQSVVHSMVYYKDGCVLAQLGAPDMKPPISYALTFPDRKETGAPALNLAELGQLTFEPPDTETFKCLRLAKEALSRSERLGTDSDTIVLNAASETLTYAFAAGRIGFLDIGDILEEILCGHTPRRAESLEDVARIDGAARETARRAMGNIK